MPPLRALLESPDLRLDGFIGPGHVSTVVGARPFEFIPADYGKPIVISGFEPLDLLQSVHMILRQLAEGRCEVENQYSARRPVRRQPAGAARARRGVRAAAALRVARARLHLAQRPEAERRRTPTSTPSCASRCPGIRVADPKACQCGEVLKGVIARGSARSSAPRARRSGRSAPAWSPPRAPAPPTTTSAASPASGRSCERRRARSTRSR